jgi:hypothetical protein
VQSQSRHGWWAASFSRSAHVIMWNNHDGDRVDPLHDTLAIFTAMTG